jgi:hypothetical protein
MNSLGSIPIVTLSEKNALCDLETVFNRTEAQNVASPRIRFFVGVSDAHSTSSRDIEADETPFAIRDGNESNIIGENVDVVIRRYGNGNFELKGISI